MFLKVVVLLSESGEVQQNKLYDVGII